MKGLVAALIAVAVSGCASMADGMSKAAGIGVVSEARSSFDGALEIEMTPAFLYNEEYVMTAVPVKLGARWASTTPDAIGLVFAYEASTNYQSGQPLYLSINAVDINIDGQITTHQAATASRHGHSGFNTVSRTIYTESRNLIALPIEKVKAMMAAKDTRLRIQTSEGSVTVQFSVERIPGGQATAIIPMREFIARVDAARLPK